MTEAASAESAVAAAKKSRENISLAIAQGTATS